MPALPRESRSLIPPARRCRGIVLAGVVLAVSAPAAFADAVRAAPHQPRPTLAGNRDAARLDARELLSALRLPPEASVSAAEPAGDGGVLSPELALNATTARAGAHAWWRVGARPNAVLAFIEAHPPAGASLERSGSGDGPSGGSSFLTVAYTWPPVPGVIGFRELAVTLTSLRDGATGVLAQAESDWIVPRPAGERVPAGVAEIDVTSARLDGPVIVAHSIRRRAVIRRIVSLIDALPVVQPGTYSCPALSTDGAHRLTLRLRGRAGGRLLARATYIAYAHVLDSGPCNPIDLSIRGRSEDPLIGGDLFKRLQRPLGLSLTGAR